MHRSERRILLADDEPNFLVMLQDLFGAEPWDITLAKDGEEALEKLCEAPFDIGVLDLYMPGLDGLEVLQHLQNKGINVKIILMTGFGKRDGTLQKAVRAVKEGAVDVIEKPFAKDALKNMIEHLLQQGDYSTHHLANQLDDYVKEHAFEPDLKLELLSAHFHITPRYVSELFRKYLNTTFSARVTQYRVEKAKHLMASTDLPLYDIAERCGFKNYRRLTAAFHRVFKMPPRKYREMGFASRADLV